MAKKIKLSSLKANKEKGLIVIAFERCLSFGIGELNSGQEAFLRFKAPKDERSHPAAEARAVGELTGLMEQTRLDGGEDGRSVLWERNEAFYYRATQATRLARPGIGGITYQMVLMALGEKKDEFEIYSYRNTKLKGPVTDEDILGHVHRALTSRTSKKIGKQEDGHDADDDESTAKRIKQEHQEDAGDNEPPPNDAWLQSNLPSASLHLHRNHSAPNKIKQEPVDSDVETGNTTTLASVSEGPQESRHRKRDQNARQSKKEKREMAMAKRMARKAKKHQARKERRQREKAAGHLFTLDEFMSRGAKSGTASENEAPKSGDGHETLQEPVEPRMQTRSMGEPIAVKGNGLPKRRPRRKKT